MSEPAPEQVPPTATTEAEQMCAFRKDRLGSTANLEICSPGDQATDSAAAPSKNELKKRAKEAEKAKKAAEKAAKQAELAAQKDAAEVVRSALTPHTSRSPSG